MARLVVLALVVLAACGRGGGDGGGGKTQPEVAETRSREVVNLRAFARLYGVVRFFHPSDEAAELDWNRFAVQGVAAVRGAGDRKALERALNELFAPIAPSVVIAPTAAVKKLPPPAAPNATTNDVAWVAWQHSGPGFDGGQAGTYESKRTAREGWTSGGGADWGSFAQAVGVVALRGKTVRLRADLRAGRESRVGAWLRVDRPQGQRGFFDNMQDRAVTAETWQTGTITGEVARDAEKLLVGGLVTGELGFFDAFVLEVADGAGGWKPVALTNAQLDEETKGWSLGIGVDRSPGASYTFTTEPRDGGEGKAARLAAPRGPLLVDLFDERPAPGETVTVPLGDGLAARVPISLPSVDGHTLPPSAGRAPTPSPPAAATPDAVAIADVIVAWNVLAHFYPYFDVVTVDWHAYLDEALAAKPGVDALRALVVAAEDGHGFVLTEEERAPLALALDIVEGKVVVLASDDAAVKPGDEIVSVDGVAAAAALDAERARQSGSPQYRTYMALASLGAGDGAKTVALELRRGGAAPATVNVKRGARPPIATYPPIGEVEPGIWLVDLSRVAAAVLEDHAHKLAAAKGIVFDMRGRPKGTHTVLAHFYGEPEHDRWMHIAHVIRPNLPGQPRPDVAWTSMGWDLEPAAPRYTAKVTFVTGPSAISYPESVMGYVEALGLPIVGAATAGSNGNVRKVSLPSGAAFTFTGMKVTRHDGTRFHLEGVRPTVPAERTIAGVTAGKDEILERALALVR